MEQSGNIKQGELFSEKSEKEEEKDLGIINPDSILNKLTAAEIAEMDEKSEYYKGQD